MDVPVLYLTGVSALGPELKPFRITEEGMDSLDACIFEGFWAPMEAWSQKSFLDPSDFEPGRIVIVFPDGMPVFPTKEAR